MVVFSTVAVFLVLSPFICSVTSKICDEKILFYKDLNCRPLYENIPFEKSKSFDESRSFDACPQAFDCTQFECSPEDKCFFKGQLYEVGQWIPGYLTNPSCYTACFCRQNKDKVEIECAEFDCPESNGKPASEGGAYKYDLYSCCAVREIFPEKENLVTCDMGPMTYLEGAKYLSPSKLETCVCTRPKEAQSKGQLSKRQQSKGQQSKGQQSNGQPLKGYNLCRQNYCMVDLTFSSELREYCAPVYRNKEDMCPSEMYCPKGTENLHRFDMGTTGEHAKHTCCFGEYTLKRGDHFVEVQEEGNKTGELYCECSIPPFLTCYRDFSQTPLT